jgi:hypothetical protein
MARAKQEGFMPKEKLSRHILPNAATMIGVSVTAVGLVKVAEGHLGPSGVDMYCALAGVIFLASAFCSYMSLRGKERADTDAPNLMERIADVCFMLGLLTLTVTMVLFAYEVI